MILESANTLRPIGWYLVAQQGETTVRVRSGMVLGRDASGELSLKPQEPLVAFALVDHGGLVITAVSSLYELQVGQQTETTRSLQLSPDLPARIVFRHNVLVIGTDFTTAAPSGDTLDVCIVPIEARGDRPSATGQSMGGQEHLPEAMDAEILVPEAGAGDSPRQRLSLSSGVFAGVVITTLIAGAVYLTSPERAATRQAQPRSEQSVEATRRGAPEILPDLEIVTPQAANPVPVSVAALLNQAQLPNEATVNFALQSLKALRVAYPDDAQIRQGLQQLASRLAREARLSYDRGDVGGAERLLTQAATSGVALAEVSEALVYISTPEVIPEPAAQPTRSAVAEGDANAPRDAALAAAEVPGPAPAINPTLTQQTPENRRAEPSLPLPSQATELPQSARAATPVSGGPTPDATAGGSTNPALYPLAQLTAIRRDPPAYPRIAPEGAEASVDLVMTVTETGTVEDVEVRGNPPDYFVRSAIQAVKRWRFLPVLDNGEPVAVRTTVRLTFRG